MIADLAFSPKERLGDGRVMRRAGFFPRATLALSSACQVAQGASERLGTLLACDVMLDLIEPVPFHPAMRTALLENAGVMRVTGDGGEAFVIIRAADARQLAAAAFRARWVPSAAVLSSLETRAVERLSYSVAAACSPVCGVLSAVVPATSENAAAASVYFEMRIVRPLRAAIGIALAKVRASQVGPGPRPNDLRNVRLNARVVVGKTAFPLCALRRLSVGEVVPLRDLVDDATLQVDGQVVARGLCGVDAGSYAFRVSERRHAHER